MGIDPTVSRCEIGSVTQLSWHYSNQPARLLWPLHRQPNFTSTYCGVESTPVYHSVLNVKAVIAALNQEKALVRAFSVITNLQIAFVWISIAAPACGWSKAALWHVTPPWQLIINYLHTPIFGHYHISHSDDNRTWQYSCEIMPVVLHEPGWLRLLTSIMIKSIWSTHNRAATA